MKKIIKLSFVFVTALLFQSCTDATVSKMGGFGQTYTVEVISNGVVVRSYVSTGKVNSELHTDGYYFEDAATNKLIEVSGQVIITQQ